MLRFSGQHPALYLWGYFKYCPETWSTGIICRFTLSRQMSWQCFIIGHHHILPHWFSTITPAENATLSKLLTALFNKVHKLINFLLLWNFKFISINTNYYEFKKEFTTAFERFHKPWSINSSDLDLYSNNERMVACISNAVYPLNFFLSSFVLLGLGG